METAEILAKLPYTSPFLFVDELQEIGNEGVIGSYTFLPDAFFYKGHFKYRPVTPGVILTECMAQIGLVCLGIFLLGKEESNGCDIGMSNTSVDFYIPVFPGEEVKVISEKLFFRFNKLKCRVKMYNSQEKLVCKGEISGMFKSNG